MCVWATHALYDTVEVYYCVFTMQGKLMSFERSTDFSGIQDVSIRRSSSVVIQNLGKRDIKKGWVCH